ncbi:MAG: CHAD domain-containing protein [Phycisphaerales bacterium]|nr:MAG: CHAD domain-containing protein [Phycisphaerales bacterium]
MSDDGRFQLLACQYLREHMDTLLAQADGIGRDDSVVCVRQATDAVRRLRVALKVFATCFPGKKVRRWRRHVGRWAKALEVLRDKDAEIEFVTDKVAPVAKRDSQHASGVNRFLLRAKQQRAALQAQVREDLDRLKTSPVLAEMHGEIEQRRFLLRHQDVVLQGTFAPPEIGRLLHKRLKQLLALQPCLGDAKALAEHRRMWTAAGRLRDTMDICNPAFDHRFDASIEVATKAEALLRDIHDCDASVDAVQRFTGEEYRRTVTYFGHDRYFARLRPGLEFVQELRIARRRETFDKLVTFWKDTEDRQVWQGLKALADTPASAPALSTTDEPAADVGAQPDSEPDRSADVPPTDDLPGTLYQRGSRWWWRVRLPGEDRARSRALKPDGSEVTTTDQGLAVKIARAMWQRAEQAQSHEDVESRILEAVAAQAATLPATVPAGAAEDRVETHEVQDEATSRSRPQMAPRAVTPCPARTVLCECCGRNGFLESELARIDSGQRLCANCLAELRRKAGGT